MPIGPSDTFTLPAGTITAAPPATTIGPAQLPDTPGAGALPGDKADLAVTLTDHAIGGSAVGEAAKLGFLPSPLYVRGEDNLRVVIFNALAGVVVTAGVRMMTPAGEIIPFAVALTPTSNRAASTFNIGLMQGWILTVDAIVTTGSPLEGQTYVSLQIIRGLTGATARELAFADGYVTAQSSVFWPGDTYRSSLDGRGALRSITGTTPAAGAEISETVPAGACWELVSLRTILTTSAAAANREPSLVIDDGALIYGQYPQPAVVTASLAPALSWGPGATNAAAAAGFAQSSATPNGLRLLAGHRIRTSTQLLQAADQYSVVQYLVRETLET